MELSGYASNSLVSLRKELIWNLYNRYFKKDYLYRFFFYVKMIQSLWELNYLSQQGYKPFMSI